MSQTLTLKIRGLNTFQNEYSEVPEGSMVVADNIVIDSDSIAEPRRGFDRLTDGSLPLSTDRVNKLSDYQDTLVVHYDGDKLGYYTGAAISQYTGTYTPPTGVNMRFNQAAQNLYFTTDEGVKRLDVISGTPVSAGAPKGLDGEAALRADGSGFFDPDNQVAYRIVWCFEDVNDNLIDGAPSQRILITNPAAGAQDNVDITFSVPDGVTTSYKYRIFRSAQSGGETVEPSDEMGLILEDNPSGAQITAKSVTITDTTLDELRGETLYTSPSQEGILNANEPPPLAKDIATFKGFTFYANTVSKHRFSFNLVSVGTPNGIQSGDTIVIDGVTYTGGAAENVGTGTFKVTTTGTASTNIADTARSLVKVINQYTANTTHYAYYTSGFDDLPGQMLIEERGIGGSAFNIQSSRGGAFNPVLSTAQPTSNDTFVAGVYFSKFEQPEAVPLTNQTFVGTRQKEIKRIIALRDSLFVFKDEGIYRIIGEDETSFRVELFDPTTTIRADETALQLNNQIFMLSDQGVATVTETGVSIVSRPIEDKMLELFGLGQSKINDVSFAVAYESDRKYILFVPTVSTDIYSTQQYVFNTITNSWTRWTLSARHAHIVPADDVVIFGDGDTNNIFQEIKTRSFRDYIDFAFTDTISAVSGKTVTVPDSSLYSVGDLIFQNSTTFGIIESIDTDLNTVQTTVETALTAAACTVYNGINTRITFNPIHAGNPGLTKHFRDFSLLFKNEFSVTGDIVFTSELSNSEETVTISSIGVGLWGNFQWGNNPWGGGNNRKNVRTYVPREKTRGTILNASFRHRVAYSNFKLEGVITHFNFMDERISR